jgi:uncharacterized protein YbaR (Trm112 family)
MMSFDISGPKVLDSDFLQLLACPRCKGKLIHNALSQSLDCNDCRLRYLVKEGIPILLVEEAQPF